MSLRPDDRSLSCYRGAATQIYREIERFVSASETKRILGANKPYAACRRRPAQLTLIGLLHT
jgi:hypothetical protein